MKTNTETTPARSTFESIAEMVSDYNAASGADNDRAREVAEQTIQESPLSVRVRSGWVDVGHESKMEPEEFEILMGTGGPAVRIMGTLNEYREPDSARIEWQDWGTPWTVEDLNGNDGETLLEFCRVFYFGE